LLEAISIEKTIVKLWKMNTRRQQECSFSELRWMLGFVISPLSLSLAQNWTQQSMQCHPSLLLLQLTAEWSINLCHKFTKNAAETRNSHFTIMKIIQTLQSSSLLINIWLLSLFASSAFKLEDFCEKSLPLCQFQSNVNTKNLSMAAFKSSTCRKRLQMVLFEYLNLLVKFAVVNEGPGYFCNHFFAAFWETVWCLLVWALI